MDYVQAEVEYHYGSMSPEQIYDAWIDEKLLRIWMTKALHDHGMTADIRKLETDPRVGGQFHFADMRAEGLAENWGTYRVLDRPEVLEFTWFAEDEDGSDENRSLVRIEIKPDGGGSRIVLTHQMDAAYAEYLEPTKKGWSTMLAAMEAALSA